MDESHDAIAVGGSLAGCAFAITLARAGRRVLVIERTREARAKVCGDFLSAEALLLLQRLGVDAARQGGHRVSTLRIASGRSHADAPLGFEGLGLSRLLLDERLLCLCAEAGARVLRGHTVSGIAQEAGTVCVRAGGRTHRGGCAALATGKHNLRDLPRRGGGPVAYKMTFAPEGRARAMLGGVVQLALYRGGYAGACLVENGGMTVCWLADGGLMRRSGGRWRDQLDLLCTRSRMLENVLRGAQPMFEKPATVAAIPFGYRRGGSIAAGVYPLGDQLGGHPRARRGRDGDRAQVGHRRGAGGAAR